MTSNATLAYRGVRMPTEQEASLAVESSRLLAACIGQGESARLRLIDGCTEVTVPVSAIHMLTDILNQGSLWIPGWCVVEIRYRVGCTRLTIPLPISPQADPTNRRKPLINCCRCPLKRSAVPPVSPCSTGIAGLIG